MTKPTNQKERNKKEKERRNERGGARKVYNRYGASEFVGPQEPGEMSPSRRFSPSLSLSVLLSLFLSSAASFLLSLSPYLTLLLSLPLCLRFLCLWHWPGAFGWPYKQDAILSAPARFRFLRALPSSSATRENVSECFACTVLRLRDHFFLYASLP